jgi:hypothetical protein
MCYDYELEYLVRRAEEARKEVKKTEQQRENPKPAAPVEVPEEKPVPA